jgi:hypothetical protein
MKTPVRGAVTLRVGALPRAGVPADRTRGDDLARAHHGGSTHHPSRFERP